MDIAALLEGRVFQVAFVVRDLEEGLTRYARLFGRGPWRVFEFAASMHETAEYRGEATAFSVRLALDSGSPQFELIQPQCGPGVHQDWLEERGEGFHHLGMIVSSLETAIARMTAAGYEAIQTGAGFGAAGDGAYAYFDTARDLGFLVEAVEPPERMPEPERVWQ
jgi:glyoxalase/bleomycin resistance protein/dioxygenase superfamily protein